MDSRVSIILVGPQMGENIGAAARAMKNFGLKDLRIVAPRDGWPNLKAQNMAVGAVDIINQARVFSSIEEAISGLSLVYATTGATRNMNKKYVLSRNLPQDLSPHHNIGIMFGRENWGLDNKEITYANKILVIDTEKNFTSLNLAHAVAVVCYELFGAKNQDRGDLNRVDKPASCQELNYFYEHLFTLLEERNFFRVPEKKDQTSNKIRNMFSRIDNFSQSELQTLRGIITVLSS